MYHLSPVSSDLSLELKWGPHGRWSPPTATLGPSILKWLILEHWDKSLLVSATGQPGLLEVKPLREPDCWLNWKYLSMHSAHEQNACARLGTPTALEQVVWAGPDCLSI